MSEQRTSPTTASLSLDPSVLAFLPSINDTTAPSSSSSSLSSPTPLPSSSSEPDSSPPPLHKSSSVSVIAGSLAGCIALVALVLTFLLLKKRRKQLRAERFSAFSFDSSSDPDPSGPPCDPLGGKGVTPRGHNVNLTPQPPSPSPPSKPQSSAPPSPAHNHSSHDQSGGHSHQKYHLQHTQNRVRQQHHHQRAGESSTSSAQSQVPLLSHNLNTNSAGPRGCDDLDDGKGLIFVDPDGPNGGSNAGVPKIVVTGHENNGDREGVWYDVADRKTLNAGERRRMGTDYEQGDLSAAGGHDVGNDGRQWTSKSLGSVSGSKHSYGRIRDAGRASGSALAAASGLGLGSRSPSSSPVISIASSSYLHGQQQDTEQSEAVNLAPLILSTHSSHPSLPTSKHQQQRQVSTPTPHMIPPPLQRGEEMEEEETPPAYENVWAGVRR